MRTRLCGTSHRAAFLLSAGPHAATRRGRAGWQTTAEGARQEVQFDDGSYVLLIGSNRAYTQGWARLSGVKEDLVAVRQVLEKHGFKVEGEENLTSDRFEARIKEFINDYGFDRNNHHLL